MHDGVQLAEALDRCAHRLFAIGRLRDVGAQRIEAPRVSAGFAGLTLVEPVPEFGAPDSVWSL